MSAKCQKQTSGTTVFSILEGPPAALQSHASGGNNKPCLHPYEQTNSTGGKPMERFNISMRKYLKEVGVTSQQAIEQLVREENLAGKGKLKVKMVLTGEGTDLKHVVEGEIELPESQ
jgi:hypothetical protein